jgi:hypothetical protein
MTYPVKRLLVFALIAAFSSVATAQLTSPAASSIALQVRFYPNQEPAYQTVSSKPGGAWYARFGHVPEWKQPENSLPVTAVNIKSELAEGGVRVWVSVFLGEIHTQEKAVTSYLLTEGEKVTARELAEFGVEPFEIKVVRLPPMIGAAPKFVSKASSIELVVMEPILSTLPAYKLVVRNLAAKPVSALLVQTLQDGRMRNSLMPQGKEAEPIITPGGTYEFNARLATRTTPTAAGYAPVILPNQVIEISSAVFDDGSFEGENDPAISFAAVSKGRKVMLEKVLGLLQKSQSANDSSAATSLDGIKSEVAALKLEADAGAVAEVDGKLTGLGADPHRLKTLIEIGMKNVRDQVLTDIAQFQLRNRYADPKPINDWLAASKDRYAAWLGRL